MKPTYTFREARVLRSVRECAEQADVARARRTEPETRIDREPLAAALKRWYGRVLKSNPTPAR